jgi:hypothetical protein
LNNTLFPTGARAALAAGVLSGIPSTAFCLVTGREPLEATSAAGSILLRTEERKGLLLLAAVPVHAAISLVWANVLAAALPQRRTVMWGAVAGLAIALLDLGPLARPFPRITALPKAPQIADHIAVGVIAAASIECSRRAKGQSRLGP